VPVKVKYLQTVPNETKNRTSRPLSIKSLKKHMDFIPVQRELKKPSPKRESYKNKPHVSTAKILARRK